MVTSSYESKDLDSGMSSDKKNPLTPALTDGEQTKNNPRTWDRNAEDFKSNFIANLSHEIRSPLAVISGYAGLLASTERRTEKKQWCENILRSSRLLELLINDILSISKVEAGKIDIRKVQVNVRQLLNEVCDLLHLKVLDKGIQLDFHIEETVPARVETDPLRLTQILTNVIGNAIKFTDVGRIHVAVTMLSHEGDPQRKCIVFAVSDTGIGMTTEQKEKIFQAFYRTESSIERKDAGAGLGLSLSRSLARLLGGDIKVGESTPNKGSTFTISVDAGSPDGINSLETLDASGEEALFPWDVLQGGDCLKEMKILIVDDAKDLRELIKYILDGQGVIVTEAENGEDALRQIRENSFDLVLMDLQMPVINGIDVVRKLRAEGSGLPIFAMTAHAMDDDRDLCLASGFTDYLAKPIDIHQLIQKAMKLKKTKSIVH